VTSSRRLAIILALVACGAAETVSAQGAQRRLTTIDSIRQYPGYFHLQNVLLRGAFSESGGRILLRTDEHELGVQLGDGVTSMSGDVEVRGQLIDVGRLEPGDPRASGISEGRDAERWPRPGEELVLRVTGVTAAPAPTPTASVRSLALEPWRFAGRTVTVTGNFRGRNLFGDLPGAPHKGRYDFVIRSSEGSVWVTELRPRGRGFDLDVDRRVDSNRWVEVTGTVVHDRGLVRIEGTRIAAATAPTETRAEEEAPPPAAPPAPVEIIFSAPADGDVDVGATTSIRVQFSKGIAEPTLTGRVSAAYTGAAPGAAESTLAVRTTYDAANRAIEIKFVEPLELFRTVTVRLLEGITGFDGGPLAPWSLTFSVGTGK